MPISGKPEMGGEEGLSRLMSQTLRSRRHLRLEDLIQRSRIGGVSKDDPGSEGNATRPLSRVEEKMGVLLDAASLSSP